MQSILSKMEPLIEELKEGKEESIHNAKKLQKYFDDTIAKIRVSETFIETIIQNFMILTPCTFYLTSVPRPSVLMKLIDCIRN